MTVEIINPKPDPSVQKETVCKNCGVRLRYVPNDVKSFTSSDYSGCSDTYHYIDCPSCVKKVYVR